MKGRTNKRMERVDKAIAVLPIRPRLIQRAFDHFRACGELPEDERLADAVARVALGLEPDQTDESGIAALIMRPHATVRVMTAAEARESDRPSVREVLLDEAVHGNSFYRRVARTALVMEVDKGADPTDPQFLANHKMPEYGSVGLSLFGYPERLAKPPHEEQARRLFVRYSAILDDVHDDPDWLDDMANALVDLELDGHLPDDEELCEHLLCHVELDALIANDRGRDVQDLLSALNRTASENGEAREAALADVCALMSTGNPAE